MNRVNMAKSLRNIALCLIFYVFVAFFEALSSESDIGVFLGKIGLGMFLFSTGLLLLSTAPIRREADGYSSAFTSMIVSIVFAAVTAIFGSGAENSKLFAYAANLFEYLTLLAGIVSACMLLVGTMQLLRKKKEKKLAQQAMKTVQSFIILTSVSVALRIASSMLGTRESMASIAIVVALAYFILNGVAYAKYIRFLFKVMKKQQEDL